MRSETVKLSPKTEVKIRELNGRQSLIADEYVGASLSRSVYIKTHAACAVFEINGRPVQPTSARVEFDGLVEELTAVELDALGGAFMLFTAVDDTPDNLKNESAPAEESPQQ